MLRIRFSRTGKVGQPSFRIVVNPRTASAKGRAIEVLGNYMPARNPKIISVKKDRIDYWISKGAIPTDSVASLLKKEGMTNMDKFLAPRNKQRKPKAEESKPTATAREKPAAETPKATETPEANEKKDLSSSFPNP